MAAILLRQRKCLYTGNLLTLNQMVKSSSLSDVFKSHMQFWACVYYIQGRINHVALLVEKCQRPHFKVTIFFLATKILFWSEI